MDEIAEHLYRLGDADHPSFLLAGAKCSVLIDAGPAFMAPVYRQQLQQWLGNGKTPEWLFLTHFHYDHTGGAPYILKHFPAMKTAGSAKLGRLLARKRIVASLTQFNRDISTGHISKNDLTEDDFDYGSLPIDQYLQDGATIDLGGGVIIEVVAAPGHTLDNLSFWLPHAQAVITAEAVGIIPGDEFWVAPQFLSSYEDYVDTIERIRRLRPKIIALGHHRLVTGNDVDRFFEASLADCRQYRNMIERLLEEEQMMEEVVVRRVHEYHARNGRRGSQPEKAFWLNLQVQVKLIARRLQQDK